MTEKYKIFIFLLMLWPVALYGQYDFSADVTQGCDSLTVNYTFTSTATDDSIDYIIWDLYKPGGYDTTYSVSEILTAKYDIPSSYPVVVYINNANDPEVASKFNYIRIHRTVTADFNLKDTAEIDPYAYSFEHLDQPFDVTATYAYTWNFGDGNTGAGRDIIHTYSSPGSYNVSLNVTDDFGCTDTRLQTINVLPQAGVPDIVASVTEGCDSLKVKFSLINVNPDTIAPILWDFGNTTSSNIIDPDTVVYRAGNTPTVNYTVRVIFNGDPNNVLIKSDFITLHRMVKADFRCDDTLSNATSIIKVCYSLDPLLDTAAVYQYTWQMEGFSESNDVRPIYTFNNEPDTVSASLTIEDLTHGCISSSVQDVILTPEVTVQNVFTPNGDGRNDYFMISGGGVNLTIKIYSRSGLLVYEGEGTEIVWDGKTEYGMELNQGVYFYILTSSASEDPLGKYNKTGYIYLFR
ncbi:MAG: gliding motility-associated C-terminal domain-containing protein [Bacteroidales bacterium]|nr:gliding motility-associated C-terminal domain-containing protein [Bacteroidales bacterium]